MRIKQAVSMIPYGLLAGIVDGREVRITELGENGFVFRMAERVDKIQEISLQFYVESENCYRKIEISGNQVKKAEKQRFFTEYTVLTEAEEYQKCVRQLLSDYWKYISLKTTETDGEVAAWYTGYPVQQDDEYASCLEEQKAEWFCEASRTANGKKLEEGVELAVELDTPQLYDEWLQKPTGKFVEAYWMKNGLESHPLASRKVDRLYIGNAFCPHLFPPRESLQAILKKAKKECIPVTLTFPWIKEGQLEDVKECLVCLEQTGECLPDEMVVNDWGLLHLLWRWKQQTQNKIRINLGILLGRPKKDTRCRYLKTEAACFRKTNLNSDFYQEYLKKYQIERYELEACGHELAVPEGRHSLHIPFFQTNTAQFCTLYAKFIYGDRGRQEAVKKCPKYCRELAFLYPRHLEMFGKYNTLFGYDRQTLQEMGYLNQYIRQGIDRIVVNLM